MFRHPLTLLTREVPPLILTRERTCLLLQDLHSALADPDDGWLACRARAKVVAREFDEYFDTLRLVAPNVERLLTAFRIRQVPVIYSCLGRFDDEPLSEFQKAIGWDWRLDGPDGEFPELWRPREDEPLFTKPGWSALANPEFRRYLDQRRTDSVVVVGTFLDFGIRQTCYELADLGIGTLIVSDAVVPLTDAGGAYTAGNLAHGLSKLRSTAELLDLLSELDRGETVIV